MREETLTERKGEEREREGNINDHYSPGVILKALRIRDKTQKVYLCEYSYIRP